jgi:hypothetical protein
MALVSVVMADVLAGVRMIRAADVPIYRVGAALLMGGGGNAVMAGAGVVATGAGTVRAGGGNSPGGGCSPLLR